MAEGVDEQRGEVPDPAVIAQYVFSNLRRVLPDVTQFDLMCFAAQMIAVESLEQPVFKPAALEMNKIVYAIYDHHKDGIITCLKSQPLKIAPLPLESPQELVERLSRCADLRLMTDENLKDQ